MQGKDVSVINNSKANETIIAYIKDLILHGKLREGQRLPPERQLALKLGVSRNSVREALSALSIIGVISSTQGAGNYISEQFDKSLIEWMDMMYLLRCTDYRQFYELRCGLEIQAAKLALFKITDSQIRELQDITHALAASSNEKSSAALDKQLHYKIIAASGNYLMLELFQAVSHMMDTFIFNMRKEITTNRETLASLQITHDDIVNAFALRDEALLLSALNKHFLLVDQAIQSSAANHCGEIGEEDLHFTVDDSE